MLLLCFMANITAKATGIKAGRGWALMPLGRLGPHHSGGSCVLRRHLVAIRHMTAYATAQNGPPEARVGIRGARLFNPHPFSENPLRAPSLRNTSLNIKH